MRVIHANELTPCAALQAVTSDAQPECASRTIAGITMELQSNVPGLANAFAERYSDHPPCAAPDFVYTVWQDADGYAMWCDHDGCWRWPHGPLPLDAVLFLADAAAISALVHYDNRLASLHAAGIEYFGVAGALAAHSGGGKTTTALACARAGMRIYSDERVLVRERTALPFLRRCSLRDEQMRECGSIAWTQAFGADCVAPPARLRALFVIRGKGALSIEPVEPAQALGSIGRWFDCTGGALQRIARAMVLLRSLRCYALTLGSPQESALAVRGVLEDLAAV